MDRLDCAVIGSGPAGLEAALNLKIRGKRFLLFGTPELSRKLEAAPLIDNYLGLPGISGKHLQERFLQHLGAMGIEILSEQVQLIYPMGGYFSLATAKNSYEAATVILAPGVFSAKLLEGETEFLGRGVGYCATCDAPLYKGKTVAVLGYYDEAVYEAEYLSEIAGKVYYVPMAKTSRLPGGTVEILEGRVTGIAGSIAVQSLMFEGKAVAVDGVFILRNAVAPASLIPGIAMEEGFIRVGADMATSYPGCFAAGDCTGRPHQYMRAAGQGQTAALNAVMYIDHIKSHK